MKIIFLSGLCSSPSSREICLSRFIVLGLLGLLLLSGAMLWLGYQLGRQVGPAVSDTAVAPSIEALFAGERRQLAELRERTHEDLDALALRMGSMQAHILRLDALGQQLTQIGRLDRDEFDFNEEPPLGGAADAGATGQDQSAADLVADMGRLARLIEDRGRKLDLLEDLMMNQRLQQETRPTGRPIKKGWISSYFGRRTDPFTGKKTMHKGLDFAGKKGSDVMAVAAGLVTRVGAQGGYGNLVEINHGNGYVTRYGHNAKVLVEVGDRVTQGEVIAKMGSTGRSTGPHVHFEVVRNGRQVNPVKYVRASPNSSVFATAKN